MSPASSKLGAVARTFPIPRAATFDVCTKLNKNSEQGYLETHFDAEPHENIKCDLCEVRAAFVTSNQVMLRLYSDD